MPPLFFMKGRDMKNMPSNMTHSFARVPKVNVSRSVFNRDHSYKTTFDAGLLIPVFVDEALPGDTMNLNMTGFSRLATPQKPFMDNLFMDTFFFAIPYRLVWENWERFNGHQDDPGDSTDFLIPQMTVPAGGHQVGSLSDYFGIPTGVEGFSHSSLVHRAYNLVWNEWFRDQNLQDSIPVPKGDGPDVSTDFVLKRRGKRHDYFTSCLPWPQKGPAVSIPIGDTAPVIGIGATNQTWNQTQANAFETGGSVAATYEAHKTIGDATNTHQINIEEDPDNPGFPNIRADLSEATAATINMLRQAFQIQKVFERDARGGTRYPEVILSHFGVVSPDARLQRPEYLGGGTTAVNVNPIAQTTPSDVVPDATPQGNLAAFGTASLNRNGFTHSFTEHCIVIGLVSVRADLTYQQGLDRMWSRSTRFDYFWPGLQHLGEQEVLNKEIWVDGTEADEEVFGYQERYAEYRYKNSKITGQFRSDYAQSLDVWHASQDFAARPNLNETFIEEDPPIDRLIAVPSEPHFLFDAFFKYRHTRPMATYGVPGFIDHF